MTIPEMLYAIPAGVVMAVQAIFAGELICGIWPGAKRPPGKPSGRVAILIPAHNEAAGISETLHSLKQVCPADATILVVADNCSDDTADVARAAGVIVTERVDPLNRGKGFALDHGRKALSKSDYSVAIILDADCLPEKDSIEALATAAEGGVPAQSVNLLSPGTGRGPMVEISSFAFMIKNLIRQRGLVRSGGPALLTGTGMAFPRELFERLPLATGNIVEDLALTVRLAGQRIRPRLEPNARVWSAPAAAEDTLIQRERWEHGFLETALRFGLPSILSGLRNRNWVEARLGLHLLVPPLVLLFLVTGAVLLAGLAGIAAGMAPAFAVAVGISLTLSIIALAAAWWTEGRSFLAFRTLLRIPGYMLWKIPVYLKFVRARQTEWIRTERTPD